MFHIMAVDYSTPKRERKEYVYYEENWNADESDNPAKNRFGNPISPVCSHIEGRWYETKTKEILATEVDSEGIEQETLQYRFEGLRACYYIPFSKKAVEDIVKKSVHSDSSSIRFIVKLGTDDYPASAGASMRNQVTYDSFVNWSFDEIFRFMTRPLEKANDWSRPVDKTGNSLSFKPQ